MPKQYFVTNSLRNDLPMDFVNSKNKRYIHVINFKLMDITSGKLLMDVSAHSDFIKDHPYLNGFMCFCNEQLAKRKKYEIMHHITNFNLWFQDLYGNVLNPSNYLFTGEFMLEY